MNLLQLWLGIIGMLTIAVAGSVVALLALGHVSARRKAGQ